MLEYLLSLLLIYQYSLIFIIAILAAFWVPLPATAILIASGVLYTQGYFDIWYLFLSGFFWCVIGDSLGFGISYIYGKNFLLQVGVGKFINIEKIVSEYGTKFSGRSVLSVFLSRWLLTGFWPSVNVLAGIMKMSPIIFFLTVFLWEALYMTLVISIWYSFGNEWEAILDIIESFSTMLVSFLLLIIMIYILWWFYKNKDK